MSWVGSLSWMLLSSTFSIVFCVPIAFYAFYKSVYDFGPIQRSLWEILTENIPREGYYVERQPHNNSYKPPQKRITARPVSRKSLRNKRIRNVRAQPLLLFQRANHCYSGNYGFKTNQITPIAAGHNVYSTYSSPHAATMGLGCFQASDAMSNIFYYAIYSISFPKLVFLEEPKEPPGGI